MVSLPRWLNRCVSARLAVPGPVAVIRSAVFAVAVVCSSGAFAGMEFDTEFGVCRDFPLYRELVVYKEPTIFLTNLNRILIDPEQGMQELMQESPVFTTLKGSVKLKLGRPETFKNFSAISKLYELAEPRLEVDVESADGAATIHMVQNCKTGELGFVLQQDLLDAQQPKQGGHSRLPPSTRANPIPQLHR
jgi:hypothetical protein